MALSKCTVPTDVIGSLGTTPQDRGLTTQEFKDKFDEMPEGIKDYLNNTLTEEIDAQLTLKANKNQEAWTPVTTINNWTSGAAGYMKDELGFVHLRGEVSGGSLLNAAFILPTGYRPSQIERLSVATNNGTDYVAGQVTITAAGEVIPTAGLTAPVYLDGIVFRAV